MITVLCGPDSDFASTLLAAHWVYYAVFIAFILIANLTVLNMLIGILCNVVSNVADEAKEESFQAELHHQIARVARDMDEDGSGTISSEEFEVVLQDPAM